MIINKIRIKDSVQHNPNMEALLRKVRERNERTLAEKSAKWGFDFTSSCPKPVNDNTGTVESGSSTACPIDWNPIHQPAATAD